MPADRRRLALSALAAVGVGAAVLLILRRRPGTPRVAEGDAGPPPIPPGEVCDLRLVDHRIVAPNGVVLWDGSEPGAHESLPEDVEAGGRVIPAVGDYARARAADGCEVLALALDGPFDQVHYNTLERTLRIAGVGWRVTRTGGGGPLEPAPVWI